MALREISCYEDCGRTVEVDLPYVNLDKSQLDAINKGEGFPLKDYNMPAGVPFKEDWDDEDYRVVCPWCGSDS
jgi:hypothetical protein